MDSNNERDGLGYMRFPPTSADPQCCICAERKSLHGAGHDFETFRDFVLIRLAGEDAMFPPAFYPEPFAEFGDTRIWLYGRPYEMVNA